MRILTFYRHAVPMKLGLWRLRAQVLAISALRVVKGMLLGRWPWETVREIREEHRRIRAAMAPMWNEVEKRLGLPSGKAAANKGGTDR